MTAGDKHAVGSFYQVCCRAPGSRTWVKHRDHFAASLPYGAFAPAELYDVNNMLSGRIDANHFADPATANAHDAVPRQKPPTHILQIHVPTATERCSFAGLTERFRRLADKIRHDEELSPADEILVHYDGIQLLPIEPTIELENERGLFQAASDDEGIIRVRLRKPDITGNKNPVIGRSQNNSPTRFNGGL